MTYDSPKAGFFDFQTGGQGRRFGSNGFYAAYNPDQFEQTATALGSLRWIKEWGLSESAPTQVTARISTVMNGHAVHRPITTTPTTSERSSGATCSGGEAPLRWVATTSIITFSAPIWANRWPLRAAATSAKPNATWAICGLRHSMRWRRFAIAASAGASFTPYGTSVSWAVSGRYGNGGWQAEAGAAQSMRLPTFTRPLLYIEAQVNNPNLKPERAVTYHIGGGLRHRKMACLRTVLLPRTVAM